MDRTDIEECECPVEGHMTGCPNDLWAKALCDLERGKEPVATVVDQLCDLALRGLERGAEPVALLLPENSINDIQAESIKQLISRAKHAHYVDVKIRINGQDEHYQADWLKHLQLSAPPAEALKVANRDAEIKKLREVMMAAAEELGAHWDAHCDAEGCGPVNLERRLREKLAVSYPGYSIGAWAAHDAELAALRADNAKMGRMLLEAEEAVMLSGGELIKLRSRAEEAERKLADARREGMEEAARICNKIAYDEEGICVRIDAEECEDAIRAALDQPEKEQGNG